MAIAVIVAFNLVAAILWWRGIWCPLCHHSHPRGRCQRRGW